jgi:hypothetical protein
MRLVRRGLFAIVGAFVGWTIPMGLLFGFDQKLWISGALFGLFTGTVIFWRTRNYQHPEEFR